MVTLQQFAIAKEALVKSLAKVNDARWYQFWIIFHHLLVVIQVRLKVREFEIGWAKNLGKQQLIECEALKVLTHLKKSSEYARRLHMDVGQQQDCGKMVIERLTTEFGSSDDKLILWAINSILLDYDYQFAKDDATRYEVLSEAQSLALQLGDIQQVISIAGYLDHIERNRSADANQTRT